MTLTRNTFNGFLGISDVSNGIIPGDLDGIVKPRYKSFTFTENSSTSSFNVTIPSDTGVGDLLFYIAGCRDGRTQNSFTGTGWTDLAVGLENIFVRYKFAQLSDIGATVGGNWSSNTTGPAAIVAISSPVTTLSASVQGRTTGGYSVNPPPQSKRSIAIFFNQDRIANVRTPGLSEDLRTAAISTNSFYTYQLERTTVPYPVQAMTNVSTDSVCAYIVIGV